MRFKNILSIYFNCNVIILAIYPLLPVQTDGCAHGYCVVYSTADRSSFVDAEKRLQDLWAAGHTAHRAVILVGNKADLARSRSVATDGE